MLPTQNRPHRASIPATGLGSILVAVPQLALVGDRAVVVTTAVAVGLDGSTVPVVGGRASEVGASTAAAPRPAAGAAGELRAATAPAAIEAGR